MEGKLGCLNKAGSGLLYTFIHYCISKHIFKDLMVINIEQ